MYGKSVKSVKNTSEIQLREEIFYSYTLDGPTELLIKRKMGVSMGPLFCRPAGTAARRDFEKMVNDDNNDTGLLFCS